jgi:Flp pilus assembly protein TadD
MHRPCSLVTGCIFVFLLAGTLHAGDLRITLPKRSKPTPVQKLNQDGVAAVKKHDYQKAKQLFYKAYLLDPDDPFTLNNLGYIAELEGDLDRAQRFYELSADQRSDATVVKSTSPTVEGKAVSEVAGKAEDAAMSINRYNVAAIGMLNKERAPEADLLLQKALALDGKNPFTLNNLGYTREKEGEYEQAMNFYQRAAITRSEEPIVVTLNPDWRGKPISEVAAENADNLRKMMRKEMTPQAKARFKRSKAK